MTCRKTKTVSVTHSLNEEVQGELGNVKESAMKISKPAEIKKGVK